MARLKLINLHTTGTSQTSAVLTTSNPLELGEIAVQHNESEPKLYIRLSDAANGAVKASLASFIPESEVDTRIQAAISAVNTDVSDLSAKIGEGFDSTNTVAKAIDDETSARTAADTALQAAVSSAQTDIATVAANLAAEVENRSQGDTTLGGRIDGVVSDVSGLRTDIGDLEAADTALGGRIDAEVTARQNAVADEASARTAADTALDNRLKAVEGNLESGYTKTAINELSGSVGTNATNIAANESAIGELQDALGTGFSAQNSVSSQLAAVKSTADGALQSISTGTADNYITVTVGQEDSNHNQTVAAAANVKAISAVTSGETFLADAYDVKQEINKVSGGASEKINQLEGEVDTLQAQLSGFSESDGSVKTYVDEEIADAIASVYKVKGSVATYNDLPSSNLVEGDVYNVQGETELSGNIYPAGTNFVWVADDENTGHWDALGGTVNLAPYMLKSDFNTWTANTYTTKINAIDQNIGDLQTSAQTNANAITAETQARENAVSGLNTRVTNLENDLSSGATKQKLDQLEQDITAETQARISAVSGVNSTVATLRSDLDTATAATQTLRNDLNDEISARTAADTALDNRVKAIEDSIGEGGSVADQLSALTAAIEAEETARIAGDTAITNTVTTLRSEHDTLAANVGTGFSAQSTVAQQLAAVKTTADSAIQTITVDNTATNKITATKNGTSVALNFDEMVIDCGTYGA